MFTVALVSRERDDTLRHLLARSGYEVIACTDPDSLPALADEQSIAVVLLHPSARGEQTMPDMVRAVHRALQHHEVAIVPMLPRTDLAERVRSLWYGASNVVNLPLRGDELLSGIASVLGRDPKRAARRSLSAAV